MIFLQGERIYNITVGLLFGADNKDAALELYPPIPGADQRLQLSVSSNVLGTLIGNDQMWCHKFFLSSFLLQRILNDYAFYCPTVWSAESIIDLSNASVYSYLFTHPYASKEYIELCSYLSCEFVF